MTTPTQAQGSKKYRIQRTIDGKWAVGDWIALQWFDTEKEAQETADRWNAEPCAQERNDTEHLLKSPANAEAIRESVEQADRGELQEIKDKS